MTSVNVPRSFYHGGGHLGAWLFTHDHKRVGILFLITTTLMLFLGGVYALVLRLEHLTPDATIMDALAYNRAFTVHGIVMVWLFMIPAIPSGFGNIFVPIMIGAEEVAFPKVNIASWWVFVLGATVTLVGVFVGGADTGWTFYPPYSSVSPTAVAPAVLGVFIIGWSTVMTGINFLVTIHTMRAKGLPMMKMPLFVWAIYGTSIIQVVATPVLGMALVTVFLDHVFQAGIYDPQRGGDPLLFQHMFWFYSHPAVYIMMLPAMGVVSEVIPTFARKRPFSYKAILYSTAGIAFVSFFVWGHHMFVAGTSSFGAGIFGILSMFVAIFSAIKVFTWSATLHKGSIEPRTPLLYCFAFIFLFVFGGMTGVAVATMSLDVHWHDTYFIVAHFHFVMVGAVLTAFTAALHYWFPKLTGRMYNEKWGVVAVVLTFAGFFFTFVPQFLLGNAGMPRRYFHYDPQHQVLHVISTVGSWALGAGLLITLASLCIGYFHGERAGNNPWGSMSFEWRTSSPPPHKNFRDELELEPGTYDYKVQGEG